MSGDWKKALMEIRSTLPTDAEMRLARMESARARLRESALVMLEALGEDECPYAAGLADPPGVPQQMLFLMPRPQGAV